MERMKFIGLRSIVLATALISAQGIQAQEAGQRQQVLDLITGFSLGNNAFYNKVISPAKSLDMNRSDADRTSEINTKITNELDAVLTAFKNAPEDQKAKAAAAAAKLLDSGLGGQTAARIQFIDGKPSAAIARAIILIDRTGNEKALTAKSVLDSITSYKRSAKPSDHSFEYEDATNLTMGKVSHREGSDASWVKPGALPPFESGKDFAIKKCRQIFGWKCVTTLYHAGQADIGGENSPFLYMGNYDLTNNPDNAGFGGDKRTVNQVAGSTALFVVKESKRWIMVIGVDAQWNKGGISFSSIIQSEYQKDFGRMNQRIALDLKKGKVSGENPSDTPKKKKKKRLG
jgi:hypothetical protein